jgi:glycosyltransferase involved in cell wall biosynthesis
MINSKFNVFFILTSKFPTEKAYGITTENTARAFMHLGYRTSVVTPNPGVRVLNKLEIIPVANVLANRLLTNNLRIFLKFRYNIFLIYYAFVIRIKVTRVKNILWSRDIFLSFLLTFFTDRHLVLEIHHIPNFIQSKFLKLLSKKPNVVLAPISNFLDKDLIKRSKKLVQAPMSINRNELIDLNMKLDRKNVIVYVGSPESVGNFIDFEFLNKLGFLVFDAFPDWRIDIIGINRVYFQNHVGDKIARNLNFAGFLPRATVLDRIRLAKIGLVIYEDNNLHQFPIKIVEYAASGLAILATDTESHRRILGSDLCFYFKSKSEESAFYGIRSLVTNPNDLNSYSLKIREWVENLTYENRIKRVLEIL